MTLPLLQLGIAHGDVPIAVRERLQPGEEKQREMLRRLLADGGLGVRGAFVLSTCERFELYFSGAAKVEQLAAQLAEWFQLPVSSLAPHLSARRGWSACTQIHRVAAGLASRVCGEPQILRQVRASFLRAEEAGAVDSVLSSVLRSSIHAGRRVRCETGLNESGRSIATIVADRAMGRKDRDTVSRGAVTVLGTGALAFDVLFALRSCDADPLIVIGRRQDRAERIARVVGAESGGLAGLRPAVAASHALIVCTAAQGYLVGPADVAARECSSALSVFDLSVPRNVDPLTGYAPGVDLAHLDELTPRSSASSPREHQGAERLLELHIDRIRDWWSGQCARAAIRKEVVSKGEGPCGGDRAALHRRIVALKERTR